jgi:ribose 5-phosphate isomerase
MTTKIEDHLKQQDECIKTSGYASAMEKYFESCANETIAMNQNQTQN